MTSPNAISRSVESACLCECGACDGTILVMEFLHRRGVLPTGRVSICSDCLDADHPYRTSDGTIQRLSDMKAWASLTTAERMEQQEFGARAAATANAGQAAADAAERATAQTTRRLELWRARMSDQVALDVQRWRTLPGLTAKHKTLVNGFIAQVRAVIGENAESVPTLIIHGAPGSGRTTLAYAIVNELVTSGDLWPQEALVEREDRVTAGVVDGHLWQRGAAMAALVDPFANGRMKFAALDDVGKGARLTDHAKSQAVMDQLTDALSQARTPLVITTALKTVGQAPDKPKPQVFLADYLDPSAYTRIMRNQHTITLGGSK